MKQISCIALIFLASLPLFAQPNDTRYETVDSVNQKSQLLRSTNPLLAGDTVPEVVSGETEDTGPQVVVQRKPIRKYFEVAVDSQFYYTENMFLQEEPQGHEAVDTTVLVSTVDVAVAPDPYDVGGVLLYPRIGHRYQWYNYSLQSNDATASGLSLNDYDFDAQTTYANLRIQPDPNWVVYTGFNWQRLLGHEQPKNDYNEFYRDYSPVWGVQRLFPITKSILTSVSYDAAYHWTEVDPPDRDRNDRLDNGITLSYMQELFPRLIAQVYGRYMYTYYNTQKDFSQPQYHREDHLYSTGLTLQYIFNDWASVRTYITFDHRESEAPSIDDYSNFNGGVGGSLVFRF